MAKVIIGIHGLGNKPSQKILENWWKEAMLEGLKTAGYDVKFPKFELIYWADILYEKPLREEIKDKNDPCYLDEKYVPANGMRRYENHNIRKKMLDWYDVAVDKIFLNEDMSINYSYISDSVIHKYFKDLEAYYLNHKVKSNGQIVMARDQIRKRVIKALKKYRGDDIFLIAHSMGSIVAFDILTFNLPKLRINTFATIGSPLGIPFVRSKIALEKKMVLNEDVKLRTPHGVRKWYNFSDLEDSVAINYSLKDDFDANRAGVKPIDFIVNNDYEINKEKNPHKSYGYLRAPEFSDVLAAFLQQKEKRFVQRVRRFIKWFKKEYKKQ